MNYLIQVILILLLLFGCTAWHKQRSVYKSKKGLCREAAVDLEKFRSSKRRESKLVDLVKKVPVYGTAGFVAVTETLVYASGGLVYASLVCSPVIAIEVSIANRADAGVRCVLRKLPKAINKISNGNEYHYTKNMMKELEKPVVIRYDELSRITRKNAECLLASGEKDNVDKAMRMMDSLRKNHNIWEYIEAEEKGKVNGLILIIKERRG